MASKNSKAKKATGRPRIIQTPEEFDKLVAEYVSECSESGDPMTFGGMALHLGFCDRQSLRDYEKLEEFSFTVKKARLMVEAAYEGRLSGNNVAGSIFALKNHGWSDKQEVEVTEKKYVIYASPPIDAAEWRTRYAPSGN